MLASEALGTNEETAFEIGAWWVLCGRPRRGAVLWQGGEGCPRDRAVLIGPCGPQMGRPCAPGTAGVNWVGSERVSAFAL